MNSKECTNIKTGQTFMVYLHWVNTKRGLVSTSETRPRGGGWSKHWCGPNLADAKESAARFRRIFRNRKLAKAAEADRQQAIEEEAPSTNGELSRMLGVWF